MIRIGGVFSLRGSQISQSAREANMLEFNPMTAAEVEQAALAREHSAFGTPGQGSHRPSDAFLSAEERALHKALGHVF